MDARRPGYGFRIQRDRWTPEPDAPGPRRARAPVDVHAYVPAPIEHLDLGVSVATLTALSDAEREIAALQGHAAAVGVETLAAQLLRSEAIASSQMEGVSVPSNRTLAKVTAGGRHHENAEAALEAIAAVTQAHEWALTGEPFAVGVIERLHGRGGHERPGPAVAPRR